MIYHLCTRPVHAFDQHFPVPAVSGTVFLRGEMNTEGSQAVVSLFQMRCMWHSLSLQVTFSDLPHIRYFQS